MAAINSCMPPPDETVVYQTYLPPPWAPPYDNVSQIRYYYFPDYEMFYDVWDGVFCYQSGAVWICSATLPQMYATVNLYGTFIVLVHRNLTHPWDHYNYFRHNYPRHCYEQYGPIVERNRIVPNIPRERRLVPRAFNENTNRVTFMEQETRPSTGREMPPPSTEVRAAPVARQPEQGQSVLPPYSRQVDDVPMRAISPAMPSESKGFNYGSGYTKPPPSEPKSSPARAPAPGSQAPSQVPSQAPGRAPGGPN